jgi:hypothetical protein
MNTQMEHISVDDTATTPGLFWPNDEIEIVGDKRRGF